VASSGIAALLLPGGSTSHSRFSIPLNSTQGSQCSISKGTQAAGLLERASLIIWDEVPMQSKYDFEAVDRTLRDIRDCEEPFGGLSVILGGDFAQILPVVKRANRARTVAANLQQSFLWQRFTTLFLRRNMRLISGADNTRFGEWIRNLSYDSAMYGRISLPAYIHTTDSAEVFFYKIYLMEQMQLQGITRDISFFRDRAILLLKTIPWLISTCEF